MIRLLETKSAALDTMVFIFLSKVLLFSFCHYLLSDILKCDMNKKYLILVHPCMCLNTFSMMSLEEVYSFDVEGNTTRSCPLLGSFHIHKNGCPWIKIKFIILKGMSYFSSVAPSPKVILFDTILCQMSYGCVILQGSQLAVASNKFATC